MALQPLPMLHGVADLPGLYLVACKWFHMSHNQLADNLATLTRINAITRNLHNVYQFRSMESSLCQVNPNHHINLTLPFHTQLLLAKPTMEVQDLINQDHTVNCHNSPDPMANMLSL